MLGETGRRRESYQPEIFPLDSVAAEERDRRRPEDLEAGSSALSSSSFAVTSACSSTAPASAACTCGSVNVNFSISLHDAHQSA